MIRIVRLSHLTLETPDLPRLLAHYEEIGGLAVLARDAAAAHLAAPNGRFALSLRQGETARCARLTLEAAEDADLDTLERDLRAEGLAPSRATDAVPGQRAVLTIADPDGTLIEIAPSSPGLSAARLTTGIGPLGLGHVAHNVRSAQDSVAFYTRMLGFRLSDWQGDFFAFLRCCPDHHTVNFIGGAQKPKLHHLAFELIDWDHVKRACDHLARHRVPLIWGPLRHGVGHNISIYHRDPDGNIVEHFTEMDRMSSEELGYFDPRPWHEDRPQRPKVWPAEVWTSNMWGIPTPQTFRD